MHAYAALGLGALAARTGAGPRFWAWAPLLNLALCARIARRSAAWGLALLAPGVNVIVWVLLWAEIAAALGRSPWHGVGMAVPGLNLVLLGRLAGWRPARIALATGLVAASLAPAGAAVAARRDARISAELRALDLGNPDERERAARALAELGAGPAAAIAAPGLVADLDGPPEQRGASARALLQLSARSFEGVPLEVAAPALLDAALGRSLERLPDVAIVRGLAALGPAALPRLVEALRHPDAGVRWHAAAAILHLGSHARGTAPALLDAMRDPEWAVRNAAGRALEDVASAADVTALVAALGDASAETRYHAARALGRVGAPAAGAMDALTAALRDEDFEVRMESAWALGVLGRASAPAVPALEGALGDTDPQVRSAAAWALASAGAGRVDAAAALRRALADEDREVRENVAQALESLERSRR